MNDVYRKEQALIDKRDGLAKDNDMAVIADVRVQNQGLQREIKDIDGE